MLSDHFTYQDLARRLQVNPKTVSRWVLRMERAGIIVPFRPTHTTVRLSPHDVKTLLQHRFQNDSL